MDLTGTLEEIENEYWGRTPFFPSGLVKRCYRLRKKKLCDFSPGDFRVLIGQKFSLDILFPLAIELLENSPLVEGDFYPGDLLENCLKASVDYPNFTQRLKSISARALIGLKSENFEVDLLKDEIEAFLARET